MTSALQLFQSINKKLETLDPDSQTIFLFGYTDSASKIVNFLKSTHPQNEPTNTNSVLESLYLEQQQITIINFSNDIMIDRKVQEFIEFYLVYNLINRWNLLNICLEVSFEATIQQEEFMEFLERGTKYFAGIHLEDIQKATSLVFTKIEFPEDADEITQFLQALAGNYKEVTPIYTNAIENQRYSLFLNDDDPQNQSLGKQLGQNSSYYCLSAKQPDFIMPLQSKVAQTDINAIYQHIFSESTSFLSLYCLQLLYQLAISTQNIEYLLESILTKLDKKETDYEHPHQFQVNVEEYFQYIVEIFVESDEIAKVTKCDQLTQRLKGLLTLIGKQIEGCSLPKYLKQVLMKQEYKFYWQLKFTEVMEQPESVSDIGNFNLIETWASDIQNKIIRIVNSNGTLKNAQRYQANTKLQQIFDRTANAAGQDQHDQDQNLIKRFYYYPIAEYQPDIQLSLKKDIQRKLLQDIKPKLQTIIDPRNHDNPKQLQAQIICIFQIAYECRELETVILILLAYNDLQGILRVLPEYLQQNYQDGYKRIMRKQNLLLSKLFKYFSQRMKEPRKSQKSLECLLRCLSFMESTAINTEQFEQYERTAKRYMLRGLKLEGINLFQFRKRYHEKQQSIVFHKAGLINKQTPLKQSNATINLLHLQHIDMQYCLAVIRSHKLFLKTVNNHKFYN